VPRAYNLAREISRLYGWTEKIWSRRYQAIVISAEEGVQVERLKYILSHGPKEGLVERPWDWPGVHVAKALAEEAELRGYRSGGSACGASRPLESRGWPPSHCARSFN